jgi:hypothetical protein
VSVQTECTQQALHAETDRFFAAYVIPEDVWYLIPAAILLRGKKKKKALTLMPERPRHPERYKCEGYREAWEQLLPEGLKTKVKIPAALSLQKRERQGLGTQGSL